MKRRHPERGSAIIEFVLAGIPLMFLLLLIFEFSLSMWSYHTLASAVEAGAEFASTKGADYTGTSNTIANVTQAILNAGTGLDPNQLKLTFTPSPTTSCTTATSCLTDSSTWPPSSSNQNAVGQSITVTATYPAPLFIALFWPGKSFSAIGSVTFSATSTQMIQF